QLRNVAIIAHVDHGKTTLVDQLLRQSGMFRSGELEKLAGGQHDLIMDSNPLERERGITILSKNCAVTWVPPHSVGGEGQNGANGKTPPPEAGPTQYRINIIDTPGHADFGGEVERVLRMADGCLLLVDAFEGPMPQTKFVLSKALEAHLRPVVVINKCDRPDQRAEQVVGEVFDLLIDLGADDHALDFPVVYCSGRNGWATRDMAHPGTDLRDIFEAIVNYIPAPDDDADAPLQALITTLDYSDYVGRIGIGRVFAGTLRQGQQIALLKRTGGRRDVRIVKLLGFEGLKRVETDQIEAGDLFAAVGIEGVDIGDTLADVENPVALPPVTVDEPTLSLIVRINDSPFGGREGDYVTSRQVRDRLMRELESNVALRVEPGRSSEEFLVSGRGVLHLGILLENMRREGYELSVGKPEVIIKQIDGRPCEPVETLVIDTPNETVGRVMELVGQRKGEMIKMEPRGTHITHLTFEITSRSLIGLRGRIMTATAGEAIMSHRFLRFVPVSGQRPHRQQGVMIATEGGQVTAYAVEQVHDRGILFVEPGDKVYAGQVVGEHNRDNDLPVNIARTKALTNIRQANKEQTVTLKAARRLGLEEALEYIEDDELMELTPSSIRLRKKLLDEGARRRASRAAKAGVV
ncbi:MAG: translational GTPase TypA, partial [Phycisphaerales bacterium JB039]